MIGKSDRLVESVGGPCTGRCAIDVFLAGLTGEHFFDTSRLWSALSLFGAAHVDATRRNVSFRFGVSSAFAMSIGSNTLRKLFVGQFCVSIKVKSTQDSDQFTLSGHMASGLKESLQVFLVNVVVPPVIDCFEAPFHIEIILNLQLSLQLFQAPLKRNLSCKEVCQPSLNTQRQEAVATYVIIGSLSACCSQVGVIAWEQSLQEIIIVEFCSVPTVEIPNEKSAILCTVLWALIVLQEKCDVFAIDVAPRLSVYPLESSIGFEVSH